MVHLAYPSGGLSQTMAMILASMAPSILHVALSEFTAKFKTDLVLEVLKGERELNVIRKENAAYAKKVGQLTMQVDSRLGVA